MAKVFNTFLQQGVFPAEWKRARLVLLRKADRPLEEPSTYRPLCMLDAKRKLLEKVIDERLKAICDGKCLLTANQYGFRRGKSTLDFNSQIMRVIREGAESKGMVGIPLLDVKNAFNSTPWQDMADSLCRKAVPGYICKILDDYLDNRSLHYDTGDGNRTRHLTPGVPQGYKYQEYYNVLYDCLIRLPTPEGVQIVPYAIDVAVVAKAPVTLKVDELLEEAAEKIMDWLGDVGIELALQKNELIVPTRKRTHNTLSAIIKGHKIESKSSVKYLGVNIDQKTNYKSHAVTVAKKTVKITRSLRGIMPNLGGPKHGTRKLLASVLQSVLLYGAPA